MRKLIFLCLIFIFLSNLKSFEPVDHRNSNKNTITDGFYLSCFSAAEPLYESKLRYSNSEVIGFCNIFNSWYFDYGYFQMELQYPWAAENCNFVPYISTVCTLCFDGNFIWGTEFNGCRLFSVNYENGEQKVFGLTESYTVLDYCERDRELYGITFDGDIYSIVRETGESRLIGHTITDIAGGCLGNDNYFYCMERNQGEFVRIDPVTGDWESLAVFNEQWNIPIGFACDRYTGLIYYMNRIYNITRLCSYDPINNEHEIIGSFPDNINSSALCIPSWHVVSGTAKQVSNLRSNINIDVELTWINPLDTVNGEYLSSISEIQVYRDENLIGTITDTEPGTECGFTDTNPNNAMNYYKIIVINETGAGAPREREVWFGPDMPGKVKNIIASKEGNSVQLHWMPAEEGRHLGNWDGNITNYHILCSDGTEGVVNGTYQTWTHYPQYQYMLNYQIIAENDIGISLPEQSAWIDYSEILPIYMGNNNTPFTSTLIPFSSEAYDGLCESIYAAEFIRGSGFSNGEITSMSFELNNSGLNPYMEDITYQIFIGETDQTDLMDGWILASELQLVYEGLPYFQQGNQNLLIEFIEPYQYHGTNLVILIHRSMLECFFYCNSRITDNYKYPYCTRILYTSDQFLEPINLISPSEVTACSFLPNIRLYREEDEYVDLSGTVIDNGNNEVIPGVRISLNRDNNIMETISGFNGSFYIPDLLESEYLIQVVHDGYKIFGELLDIERNRELFDVFLTPAELIDITGHVVTNEGDNVSGAEVILEGLISQIAYTDEEGDFIIQDIWDSNDYDLEIRHFDLNTIQLSFRADSIDMDLGNIVLNEHLYPVYDVYAVINNQQQVDISWSAIDTTLYLFEDFEYNDGGFTFDRGWGWGADTLILFSNGSEKLWGTALNNYYGSNVNYNLFSPELSLTRSDYKLSFYHLLSSGYNTAANVKISTDNGDSWEILYPLIGYPGIMENPNHCMYNEPSYLSSIHYWREDEFDLSDYYGNSIIIRWQFATEFPNWEGFGWYIDNVAVSYDNTREMQSYRIIKGIDPLLDEYQDWEIIASGLNNLAFCDTNWVNTSTGGNYRYGVQVEYSGAALSEPSYSEILTFGEMFTWFVILENQSGNITQTRVSLTSQDGLYHYEQSSTYPCFTFDNIWQGDYLLQIHSYGFYEYQEMIQIYEHTGSDIDLIFFLFPPISPEVNQDTGIMQWLSPQRENSSKNSTFYQREELTGYKVYVDSLFLAETVQPSLDLSIFPVFIIGNEYSAGVSAIYEDIESEIITTNFTCNFNCPITEADIPKETNLQYIYPNPFNPVTNIAFQLSENSQVNITLYNIKGEKISTQVNHTYPAGYHTFSWNSLNLPSGIYLLNINLGQYHESQKILLLK